MINNTEDVTNYTNYNKVYIPTAYINQNWKYNFNGDYIIIRTNQNCRTSYNTQYCDCRSYNMKNNVISSTYECNYTSDSNQSIAYESLSYDINDSMYIRDRFIQDKGMILGIFIIGLVLAILMTKRGAYR